MQFAERNEIPSETPHEESPRPVPRKGFRDRLKLLGVAAGIYLTLLIVYVLSIGPALKLEYAGVVSERTVAKVYRPLFWCCQRSKPADSLLDWYAVKFIPSWYLDGRGRDIPDAKLSAQ